MSTTKKIVIVFICVFCMILGTGYFLGMAYFQTHYKIGTTINGFHCSFQTINEADELLTRKVESYAIAVETRNNGVEKITADEAGLTFHGKDELVQIIKNQNSWLWFLPEMKGYSLPAECYSIDEEKMGETMASLKCMNSMVKSEGAHIVNTKDYYQVAKAVKGTELDKRKTRNIIETAIRKWSNNVNLEETGCYIDADPGEEEPLQTQCDILNKIQDEIITYDFGDRKETVTFDTVKKKFFDENYLFDEEKIAKYIENIAKKYDTVGGKRKFITFDDRSVNVTGGDYGWKINTEKTAEDLLENIKNGTIDVIEPVYEQTAESRDKNDIGHSYLEIDTIQRKAVLYIDGKAIVQTSIKTNGTISSGCYKVKNKENMIITFGKSSIYADDTDNTDSNFTGTDDISGYSQNNVKKGCMTVKENQMKEIFEKMEENWPIIIY